MYEEYEVKNWISLAVVILLVLVVFGGWIYVSIFVLPNIPQHIQQRANFIVIEGNYK